MTVAESLETKQRNLARKPEQGRPVPKHTVFYKSLRSKGYVFFLLVLTYMILATVFFFSQREKPLLQLEEYARIQQTHDALVKADLAAFHVVTALFSQVTQDEILQVSSYFSSLETQYRNLATLFPEQAEAFRKLGQSIPVQSRDPEEIYLQKAHLHLAKSKNEIERLIAANQGRMTELIREYRNADDLLVVKSLVLGTVGLILIGTITTLFFNRLKSDILRLQQRTAEIVKGYRGSPLPVTRQDEVGELTEGINYMSRALAEREQALEIERRKTFFKEKMIAIDSLAGGIAHEIGNPITCIAGLADEIASDAQNRLSEDSRARFEQLQQYTDGIIMITRDLSHLDTKNLDESDWIDLNQLLTNSVNLCRYDNRWSAVDIRLDLDPEVPAVFVSENQFNQLTMHILENALDAVSEQPQPVVHLQTRYDGDGGIAIVFEDNGVGIEGIDPRYIFEPFYTTKGLGEGTGLGLAICWTIVKTHNGDIQAEPVPGGGLKISIDLPCDSNSLSDVKPR